MAEQSTQTTGGDSVAGLDPGGTRSTRPGNPDKSAPAKPHAAATDHHVTSGDRNAGRPGDLAQDVKAPDRPGM